MATLLILPWPNALLSQNSRAHHFAIAKAVKKARGDACLIAQSNGLKKGPWVSARLEWTFHPPDKRHYDCSNIIGRMKAAIDGIQDALELDDKHFANAWPERLSEPVKYGRVNVLVTPIANIASGRAAA